MIERKETGKTHPYGKRERYKQVFSILMFLSPFLAVYLSLSISKLFYDIQSNGKAFNYK
jgi:hypothetical protein